MLIEVCTLIKVYILLDRGICTSIEVHSILNCCLDSKNTVSMLYRWTAKIEQGNNTATPILVC